MRLIVLLLVLLASNYNCFSQQDSIAFDDFQESLSMEFNCDSDPDQIKERIKLINTFSFYKRSIDESSQKDLLTSVNTFQDSCWEQIKTDYAFRLTAGLGYFSSNLDIKYGGSFSREEDFYMIKEYSDYVQKRKDLYLREVIVIEHLGSEGLSILPAYFLKSCSGFENYVKEDQESRYLHQCLSKETFIKIDSIIESSSLKQKENHPYTFGTFRISKLVDNKKIYEFYIEDKYKSIAFFQSVISAMEGISSSDTISRKMNYFVEVLGIVDE